MSKRANLTRHFRSAFLRLSLLTGDIGIEPTRLTSLRGDGLLNLHVDLDGNRLQTSPFWLLVYLPRARLAHSLPHFIGVFKAQLDISVQLFLVVPVVTQRRVNLSQ